MITNFMNRRFIWNGIVHIYIVPQDINIWISFFFYLLEIHIKPRICRQLSHFIVYSSNYKPRSGTDTEFLINDNNAPIQIVSISRKLKKKSGI